MPLKSRAQVSVEFVILISFMLLFFLAIAAIIQERTSEVHEGHIERAKQETGAIIKAELNLAFIAPDGYKRAFRLPPTLIGKPYNISLLSSENGSRLVLRYYDPGFPQEEVVVIPRDVSINLIYDRESLITKENGNISLTIALPDPQEFPIVTLSRTQCSDGRDNDGDNCIDTYDGGCTDSQDDSEGDGPCTVEAVCVNPTSIRGDLNNDGALDGTDVELLSRILNKYAGIPAESCCVNVISVDDINSNDLTHLYTILDPLPSNPRFYCDGSLVT